jgi:hypothetical protein
LCEEKAVKVFDRCNRLEDFCSGAVVEGTGAVVEGVRDVEFVRDWDWEEVEELRSLRVKRRRRDINAMVRLVLASAFSNGYARVECRWAVQWLFTCC